LLFYFAILSKNIPLIHLRKEWRLFCDEEETKNEIKNFLPLMSPSCLEINNKLFSGVDLIKYFWHKFTFSFLYARCYKSNPTHNAHIEKMV
jgi:hypothetical protein